LFAGKWLVWFVRLFYMTTAVFEPIFKTLW
jgi:hypothetical protein